MIIMKALLISLLLFSSTSAWATRARLLSLGLDEDGTQIIRDNRNIFLNPAEVAKVKEGIYGEWGDSALGGVNPDAEGGLVYDLGGFKTALQLGRQTVVSDNINIANPFLGGTLMLPQNSIDVIGGKTLNNGMAFGVGLHFANSSDETSGNVNNDEARQLSVSAGLMSDKFGAYARFDFLHASEDTVSNTEYDGDLQFSLGGFFNINEKNMIRAEIDRTSFDARNGGVTQETSATAMELAFTHYVDTGGKALVLFFDGGINWADGENSRPGLNQDISVLSLPLTIGVEAPVKSWLDFRASVRQTVILDRQEVAPRETANLQSTQVAGGVGIKLGDFTIDGVLRGSTGTAQIDADDILGNVAVTYNF
jgi:hypothetical protein